MSVQQVIITFIAIGLALCLAVALMPVTGSILVFLVAVVGGGLFLIKGLRDLRTQPSPRIHPPQKPDDEQTRRTSSEDASVIPLPSRKRTPPDRPSHA